MTYTATQLWAFAERLAAATTNAERLDVLAEFRGAPYGCHPQSVKLQAFARAVAVNGSRRNCPEVLVRSLEKGLEA